MYYLFFDFIDSADHRNEEREDSRNFNRALGKALAEDPNFDPEIMGAYMADRLGIIRGGTNNPKGKSIERCVTKARTVKEYLEDQA